MQCIMANQLIVKVCPRCCSLHAAAVVVVGALQQQQRHLIESGDGSIESWRAEAVKDTPDWRQSLLTLDSARLCLSLSPSLSPNALGRLCGRGTAECFPCARLLTAAHTQGRSRWQGSGTWRGVGRGDVKGFQLKRLGESLKFLMDRFQLAKGPGTRQEMKWN